MLAALMVILVFLALLIVALLVESSRDVVKVERAVNDLQTKQNEKLQEVESLLTQIKDGLWDIDNRLRPYDGPEDA